MFLYSVNLLGMQTNYVHTTNSKITLAQNTRSHNNSLNPVMQRDSYTRKVFVQIATFFLFLPYKTDHELPKNFHVLQICYMYL